MSVNYSEKNIASTKADNRNFRTIAWNNLSSQPTNPIQALAMSSLLPKLMLISVGVLNVSRTGGTAHISYCDKTSATTCDGLSTDPQIHYLLMVYLLIPKISFTRTQKLSKTWVQ